LVTDVAEPAAHDRGLDPRPGDPGSAAPWPKRQKTRVRARLRPPAARPTKPDPRNSALESSGAVVEPQGPDPGASNESAYRSMRRRNQGSGRRWRANVSQSLSRARWNFISSFSISLGTASQSRSSADPWREVADEGALLSRVAARNTTPNRTDFTVPSPSRGANTRAPRGVNFNGEMVGELWRSGGPPSPQPRPGSYSKGCAEPARPLGCTSNLATLQSNPTSTKGECASLGRGRRNGGSQTAEKDFIEGSLRTATA
jgi:hypothetical protein